MAPPRRPWRCRLRWCGRTTPEPLRRDPGGVAHALPGSGPHPRSLYTDDDGDDHRCRAGRGLAVARPDGLRPRGLLQLGPARQRRGAQRGADPSRVAGPRAGRAHRFDSRRALLVRRRRARARANARAPRRGSGGRASGPTAPGGSICAPRATVAPPRRPGPGRRATRRPLVALVNHLTWEPAHWIMQLRQFAGLRRRAEGR